MIVAAAVSSPNPASISDATSRVIQGILTGIGFLGAGVIVHRKKLSQVHGLTSAACTWLTACVGIVCGAGHWQIVTVALALTFVVLLAGGRIERRLHRALSNEKKQDEAERAVSPANTPPA